MLFRVRLPADTNCFKTRSDEHIGMLIVQTLCASHTLSLRQLPACMQQSKEFAAVPDYRFVASSMQLHHNRFICSVMSWGHGRVQCQVGAKERMGRR